MGNNNNLKEGPRGNWFSRGFYGVIDSMLHPIDHMKSFIGRNLNWSPTLKDGHSLNNSIVVRKSDLTLRYFDNNGKLIFVTSVSTGKNSGLKLKLGDSRTPTGRFSISSYETNRDPKKFGANRFMRLTGGKATNVGIGIHGDANDPSAIGRPASHGCVRVPNDKLLELTNLINGGKGTLVYILDEDDNYKKGGSLIPKHRIGGTTILLPEVTVTAVDPNRFPKNSEMYNFTKGVNAMRTLLMQDYNFSDKKYAELSKLAINLAGRESLYGNGLSYNARKYIPDNIIRLGHIICRGGVQPVSRGLTLIKFFNGTHPTFNPNFTKYNLSENNVKNNPENQGKATAVYLSYLDKEVDKPVRWKDGSVMSDEDKRSIAFHLGKVPTDKLNDKQNLEQHSSSYVNEYHQCKIMK